jgi:hypothetical protein
MFGRGDRTLVTRNSAASPLRKAALANDIRGGSPILLAQAHETALQILAGQGLVPDELLADGVIDLVVEQERLSIEHASELRPSVFHTGKGKGPLDRSHASLERIQEWRG